MHESNNAVEYNASEVMQYIESLRHVMAAQGNIDHEMDTLSRIQRQLEKGEITAREARAQASAVEAGRIER